MTSASLTRRNLLTTGTLALLAGAVMVTAACRRSSGSTSGSTPAPSSAPSSAPASASPAPSPDAATSPATEEATAADDAAQDVPWNEAGAHLTSAPSGSAGFETAVRTGVHDGFDRVVLEMSGQGTPGYDVSVVDEAVTAGKGDTVSVAGQSVLRVIVSGATMPIEPGDAELAYSGPRLVEAGGTRVHEVYVDPTFEDQLQLFIGTDSLVYRVFTLADPTRVVIDVQH